MRLYSDLSPRELPTAAPSLWERIVKWCREQYRLFQEEVIGDQK